MSTAKKRRFRLFPRTLEETVKAATKPLMDSRGKLYGALLRDWPRIVGERRAAVTRPQRLQFPAGDAAGGVLHLDVRPAAAPSLAYETEAILEQCARHFGYRAIDRIVLHPLHGTFTTPVVSEEKISTPVSNPVSVPEGTAPEIRGVLERIATHVASPLGKKDGEG